LKSIVLDYEPRTAFGNFHTREYRWALIVAHRRSGKTVACVHELVIRALHTSKKKARYGYVAPFRSQAKAVAWEYLKDAVKGFAVKIRESDLRVELPNGAWITLYGADNPDALRGLYFDGLVLDEFADMRPALWGSVILPTLADRKGWIVIIGTPKGHNLFHEFHLKALADDTWFHMMLKSSESGLVDAEELQHLRNIMSEEQFAQEMECSFDAPVLGTYYAGIIETMENSGQIAAQACTYDPAFPVHAVCDIGYTDSTAFWFWQHRKNGLAVIDYYEAHSKPLPHYFGMLRDKGYEYDTIWLPHDAKAKTLQTGRSTVEQFIDEFGGDMFDLVPKLGVQHGIDAGRLVLPLCHIDALHCHDGIEALRAYRRRYNELTKSFSKEPLHDWASNGADSWRYLSLVCQERLKVVLPEQVLQGMKVDDKSGIPTYSFTLDKLFKDKEAAISARSNRRI
jgi:phage terminase large subunit